MIYYGDEYGMAGAGDPDNRRFMQWSGYSQNQTALHDQIAALGKMRAAHDAVRRGTRQTIAVTTDTWTYKMTTAGDTVYVALNRGDGALDSGLPPGPYKDLLTGATVSAPVQLQPRSALVLAAQ